MAIYEIKIKRVDGSIYWSEGFNSKEDAERWLTIERTRPYWDDTFVVERIDRAQEYANKKEEGDAIRRAYAQALSDLKSARLKPNKTLPDVIIIVDLIADILTGENDN